MIFCQALNGCHHRLPHNCYKCHSRCNHLGYKFPIFEPFCLTIPSSGPETKSYDNILPTQSSNTMILLYILSSSLNRKWYMFALPYPNSVVYPPSNKPHPWGCPEMEPILIAGYFSYPARRSKIGPWSPLDQHLRVLGFLCLCIPKHHTLIKLQSWT